MRTIAWTLAGVIGLMGISGCEPMDEGQQGEQEPAPTEQQEQQPETQQQQDQQTEEPLGIERSDEDLAQEVRNQIEQEAQLSPEGREITVSVQDGQVTLEGQVQSEEESQQIEQIAADVAGEENVDNQLETGQASPQEQEQTEQPETEQQTQ